MATTAHTFKSSSSDREYTTMFDPETGEGYCDCPGWTFYRVKGAPAGQPIAPSLRVCKHLKELRQKASLPLGGPAAARPSLEAEIDAPAANAGRTKPMLATAMLEGQTIDDFGDGSWVSEIKFDGFRQLFRKSGDTLTNWGRPRSKKGGNAKPAASRRLPMKIVAAFRALPDGVYDGEVYVPGGTSSDVQSWLGAKNVDRMDNPLRVVLYDLLEINGSNVTGCIWSERHEMLRLSVSHYQDDASLIEFSKAYPATRAIVDAVWDGGGEGVILKRTTGLYRPGWRSTDWIKVKRASAIVVTVTGFEAGELGPHSKVLGVEDDGRPTSCKTLDNAMRARFAKEGSEAFIGRRLVMSYTERTPTGGLRHPMFDHFEGEGDPDEA